MRQQQQHLAIRDEIQHRLIAALFAHNIASRLVFHGGTMLRVCALPDYRYSEDLDIKLVGISEDEFYSALKEIFPEVSRKTKAKLQLHSDRFSLQDYILWEGRGSAGTIGLDIRTEENTDSIDTAIFGIQQNHEGLPRWLPVRCYSLPQLLATKFACLSDRRKGRDVYDMWCLGQNENIFRQAWKQHMDAYSKEPCNIAPEDTARHLKQHEEPFARALAFDMTDLFLPTDTPVKEILDTTIKRCLLLPGMLPLEK